jgi:hypothetical protein
MDILNSLNNLLPVYETVLPFSKQKVIFSPFKVKDAKNISILLEEKNKKLALNAMIDLIKSNSKNADILNLCLADAEYLFLQIRSKSVDEQLNLLINQEKVQVFIPDILHRNEIHERSISIGKDLYIHLETPTIKNLLKLENLEKEDILKALITKVVIKGEIFYINKFLSDELKNLLDNLPMNVLPELEDFLSKQPELYLNIKTQNVEREVRGILSFFIFR